MSALSEVKDIVFAAQASRPTHQVTEASDPLLAFVAAAEVLDPFGDRYVAYRTRERVYGEIYRRERKHYPEYVDFGGEG